jgi:hypothetical protein
LDLSIISRTLFCRAVPNPTLTIRNFFIAAPQVSERELEDLARGQAGVLAAAEAAAAVSSSDVTGTLLNDYATPRYLANTLCTPMRTPAAEGDSMLQVPTSPGLRPRWCPLPLDLIVFAPPPPSPTPMPQLNQAWPISLFLRTTEYAAKAIFVRHECVI